MAKNQSNGYNTFVENNINPNNELTAPKRNLPRDVFLHLFAIVGLYWSAISFITLCWQYINHFFPDPLTIRYGNFSSPGAIRFAVASLIIIFPLFILASWQLNKIYRREAGVRDSRIRKWLIYFTLFAAALIVMGDLVSVIYNFLGGDITIRFILKALSVMVVAGVVFGYYLNDVRRAEPSTSAKYFALGSSLVALILVVGAFFIIGSPTSARLQQLDNQRVSDLQNIQWQVVNYWQRKEALPKTLADLNDPISSYLVPNDPVTNTPYEYSVKDATNLKFQLCATFSTDNKQTGGQIKPMPMMPGGVYDYSGAFSSFDHAAGHVCFDRTIDPQLYPPTKK